MKTSTTNNNLLLATILIITSLIWRVLSNQFSLFNFTPIIAMSLFAGARIQNNKMALVIPIITLFISDLVLAYLNNFSILHKTILFTYGSLILIIALGKLLKNEKLNVAKTASFSLLSSAIFFILTNFGVWLFGNLYTLNIDGLIECYLMAIPFNKFSWLGDLAFSISFFMIYEWLSVKNSISSTEFALEKNKLK